MQFNGATLRQETKERGRMGGYSFRTEGERSSERSTQVNGVKGIKGAKGDTVFQKPFSVKYDRWVRKGKQYRERSRKKKKMKPREEPRGKR